MPFGFDGQGRPGQGGKLKSRIGPYRDADSRPSLESFKSFLNLFKPHTAVAITDLGGRFVTMARDPSSTDGEQAIRGSLCRQKDPRGYFVLRQLQLSLCDRMRVALADNRLDQAPVILLLFRVAGQVQAEDSAVLEFVGVTNRRIG